jgi:hypothetical protein
LMLGILAVLVMRVEAIQADEGGCGSTFVRVPPGPGAPVGFRVEGTVLRWENRAANQHGRSPYTGELCLLPEKPPTPTPEQTRSVTPGASPGPSDGTAGRPAVVIMVTLRLVATVVGLMVLRWCVSGRA